MSYRYPGSLTGYRPRSSSDISLFGWFIAGFIVLIILSIILFSKLASDSRAVHAVDNFGWTDAHVISKHAAFGNLSGCSKDDNVQFHVLGYLNGQPRVAHVCANFPFGGYTVRN